MPNADAMPLAELLERARRDNPQLAAEQATITAAERSAELVRRNWYPDPTLGLHRVRRGRHQWAAVRRLRSDDLIGDPAAVGLRQAPRSRKRWPELAASRTRREATAADLRGQIEEA